MFSSMAALSLELLASFGNRVSLGNVSALKGAQRGAPSEEVLSLGWPELEALLPEGGFPRGAVVELASPHAIGGGARIALSAVRADLPLGFSEAVGRCLEKDANLRYTNIAELAYALVPFAVDPVRARGAADRIAATLSVAQMPRSIEVSLSGATSSGGVPIPAPTPSSPPGQNDTGTAAPWAGTHGGGRRESRNSLIWAAMALVFTLGAGGLFAMVRHDRVQEAAAAEAARVGPAAAPVAEPEAPPQVAHVTPPATASALTFDASGVAVVPRPVPVESLARPHPTAATGARKAARPAAPPDAPPSKPAPLKNSEGIPTTRD